MKKIIFLILLYLSFNTISFAQTDKEIFESGVSLFKQSLYQEAIDKFTELIKRSPEHADGYKNRGVSYMKLEKFDLAINDFEKAKSIFPELKGLYSNLGVAWYYKKEYTKAIENYDIEINMAPGNFLAYFNRAICLAEINQNEKALDDLSRATELAPDFYWAICYKADLLAQKGETLMAIETYKNAIEKDPANKYAIEKLDALKEKAKPEQSMTALPPEQQDDTPFIHTLQVGAFLSKTNAQKMRQRLIDKGFDSRILVLKGKQDRTWYIVRSGSFNKKQDAKKAKETLKQKMSLDSIIRPKGDW